jgi:hypothetical protein
MVVRTVWFTFTRGSRDFHVKVMQFHMLEHIVQLLMRCQVSCGVNGCGNVCKWRGTQLFRTHCVQKYKETEV